MEMPGRRAEGAGRRHTLREATGGHTLPTGHRRLGPLKIPGQGRGRSRTRVETLRCVVTVVHRRRQSGDEPERDLRLAHTQGSPTNRPQPSRRPLQSDPGRHHRATVSSRSLRPPVSSRSDRRGRLGLTRAAFEWVDGDHCLRSPHGPRSPRGRVQRARARRLISRSVPPSPPCAHCRAGTAKLCGYAPERRALPGGPTWQPPPRQAPSRIT